MPDDLTLPGDLPGLLRYTSPLGGDYLTVLAVDNGEALVVVGDDNGDHDVRWVPFSDLRLDLTDPTGRVHAAWWYWRARFDRFAKSIFGRLDLRPDMPDSLTCAEEEILRTASYGREMPAADIATLRDLCLRLGGRTP